MCKLVFKDSSHRRKVLSLAVIHLMVAILIFFLMIIKFPCPFKLVFGIPCPACGTLHALRAIVHLDFNEYIKNNCLAIPLVLAFFLGIHKKTLFKDSKWIDIFIYIVCFLDTVRYFCKIFIDFL